MSDPEHVIADCIADINKTIAEAERKLKKGQTNTEISSKVNTTNIFKPLISENNIGDTSLSVPGVMHTLDVIRHHVNVNDPLNKYQLANKHMSTHGRMYHRGKKYCYHAFTIVLLSLMFICTIVILYFLIKIYSAI